MLLFYDNPPNLGQPYKDPPHSANFGAGIAEKLKAVGIEHEINYNVKECIRAGGGGKTRLAGGAWPAFWSDTLLLD